MEKASVCYSFTPNISANGRSGPKQSGWKTTPDCRALVGGPATSFARNPGISANSRLGLQGTNYFLIFRDKSGFFAIVASNNEKLLDTVSQAFRAELPELSSMDEYLDFLIPKVRPWGEDLREEKHYIMRAWLEFRDDDQFHDIVLHFFNEEGEYLRSENGDVHSGHWRYLESANKFLIELKDTELYDLAYMDKNFFILKKHGEQERFGKAKYFVMAHEPLAKKLEWRDLMDLLYNTFRSNNQFYFILALIVLFAVALILILSVG